LRSAPIKLDIADEVRKLVEETGLDPDEVVAEAGRIIARR
jgi:hypothetical protein